MEDNKKTTTKEKLRSLHSRASAALKRLQDTQNKLYGAFQNFNISPLSTKNLSEYSRVPNKRVGGNKHAGGNIFQNLINMQGGINMQEGKKSII